MADYIEGKRPIIEAMRTKVPLKRIMVADNIVQDQLVGDILRKAKQRDIRVDVVSRKKLDEISARGSHQGVIAQAEPFGYVGVGEVIESALKYAENNEGRALVVLLDHLTDAGNLGAIIRSADAVGASGVVIPSKRSAHVEASTYKSSAGAVAHVPIAQTSNLTQTIKRLQDNGFWIVAASEYAPNDIWDVNLSGKIGLVMGNEHEGVSRLVLEKCDLYGRLPQMGAVSSLNVAQASTTFMYEWLRQNRPTAESGADAAAQANA